MGLDLNNKLQGISHIIRTYKGITAINYSYLQNRRRVGGVSGTGTRVRLQHTLPETWLTHNQI
jgi:hypothetical protein